jgi:hypothetical protein
VQGQRAQKRYEDKLKAVKKNELEEKKAVIRTEDMAKGIFSPGRQYIEVAPP